MGVRAGKVPGFPSVVKPADVLSVVREHPSPDAAEESLPRCSSVTRTSVGRHTHTSEPTPNRYLGYKALNYGRYTTSPHAHGPRDVVRSVALSSRHDVLGYL